MARKTKTFEIEERKNPVTVYELTVGQIIGFMQDDDLFKEGTGLESFMASLDSNILPVCTNLKIEDFKSFGPSEVKEIWDNFKEVNSVFFEGARYLGMTSFLEKMKGELMAAMLEDFSSFVATSSKQVTAES